MYCAIAKTRLDGVFKFLMIVAKTSNSTYVKIYRAASFNMFPPLLGLAISHKCNLMLLHYKSRQTFMLSFSLIMVLRKFFSKFCSQCITSNVATPLWGKCEVDTHTPENGTWESSGTPKNSEVDCRGQNTLPWGVLYTVGKILKCRCPKWPHMSHLDIYNTIYGRKKGRESNWQFDSQPLKVRNQPDPGVQVQCNTLLGSSRVCFRPHPNQRSEQEIMNVQSPGSSNQDSFGTPLWESREK
jgi:hypothetical protein